MTFRGFSVALMLLSTCSCIDLPDITVEGTDGEAASLPCTCPPDWPPYLVWQKVTADQPLVVNHYRDEGEEDFSAPEYRKRTELKLKGNCSLVFHRLSLSDQGVYQCYYKQSPITGETIHLLVTEKQIQLPEQNGQSNAVTTAACVFLIGIAIAAACLGIICRKRRQMKRRSVATSTSSV